MKNKELPTIDSQFIPRPKIPISEPYSKATNSPHKFAAELIEKLQKVIIDFITQLGTNLSKLFHKFIKSFVNQIILSIINSLFILGTNETVF